MEIKFDPKVCRYLKSVITDHKNQEQTQEVRLPDDMPDIGNILGAWGQCVLRGKQWLGNGLEVSGGTMVWVMYKAEQTEDIHCIESWIPFQFSWDMHTYESDGMMNVSCTLCSVDARNTSSRKMIVRADVGVSLNASVQKETSVFSPDNCDESIQLLKKAYKLCLPKESGEKTFSIDDELSIPASYPQISKIIRYQMRLEITDKKVITQKIVFRGTALVGISYLSVDGAICCWEGEIPFSQYSDLDNDFDEDAYILLEPALSGLEVRMLEDNKVSVSAGVICQYTVFGCENIHIAQDAYCPRMETNIHDSYLTVPTLLHHKDELVHLEHQADMQATKIVDTSVCLGQPSCITENESSNLVIPCEINVLYYDAEAVLRREKFSSRKILDEKCVDSVKPDCICTLSGTPRASIGISGCNISFDILMTSLATTEESIRMIDSLEISAKEENHKRPSVIICRKNNDTLWDIAKRNDSTVKNIEEANSLQSEPESDRILIIPIS